MQKAFRGVHFVAGAGGGGYKVVPYMSFERE